MVKKKFVTARIGEDFVSDNIDPYVGEEKSFDSRAKLIKWAITAVKPLLEMPELCRGKPPTMQIQQGDPAPKNLTIKVSY